MDWVSNFDNQSHSFAHGNSMNALSTSNGSDSKVRTRPTSRGRRRQSRGTSGGRSRPPRAPPSHSGLGSSRKRKLSVMGNNTSSANDPESLDGMDDKSNDDMGSAAQPKYAVME